MRHHFGLHRSKLDPCQEALQDLLFRPSRRTLQGQAKLKDLRRLHTEPISGVVACLACPSFFFWSGTMWACTLDDQGSVQEYLVRCRLEGEDWCAFLAVRIHRSSRG